MNMMPKMSTSKLADLFDKLSEPNYELTLETHYYKIILSEHYRAMFTPHYFVTLSTLLVCLVIFQTISILVVSFLTHINLYHLWSSSPRLTLNYMILLVHIISWPLHYFGTPAIRFLAHPFHYRKTIFLPAANKFLESFSTLFAPFCHRSMRTSLVH